MPVTPRVDREHSTSAFAVQSTDSFWFVKAALRIGEDVSVGKGRSWWSEGRVYSAIGFASGID